MQKGQCPQLQTRGKGTQRSLVTESQHRSPKVGLNSRSISLNPLNVGLRDATVLLHFFHTGVQEESYSYSK